MWLAPTKTFPPSSENDRLARYTKYELLYLGKHNDVWKDIWDMTDMEQADNILSSFFTASYGPRKLEFNWFKVLCNVYSDFLVGESPRISAKVISEQNTIDAIRERSNLDVVLHNAVRCLIKEGDVVFKCRFKGAMEYTEPGSVIELVDNSIWFPITNPDNKDEYTAHVLAWTFMEQVGSSTAKLLKVEIHTAGFVTHRLFWMNGNTIEHEVPIETSYKYSSLAPQRISPEGEPTLAPLGVSVETGVKYPLVFVVSNPKPKNDVHGTSDFDDIENLVHELYIRIIKISSILDIHSRPIMTGPDNVLTTDMITGEEKLRLNGRYFPLRDPANRVQYITWDGKLDSSFKEMDKITDMIYKITDLNPAALGDYSQGMQVSGSAWRRLMVRTLARVSRLRMMFDVPVKRAISAASSLDVQGRMPGAVVTTVNKIMWQDGLPKDTKEDTLVEQARKNSGLTSKLSSIMRLDECSEADAQLEIDRMAKEIPDAPREQSPYESRFGTAGSQPRADDTGSSVDVMK